MIDVTTGERLIVSTAGDAEPYLIVPLDQLDDVCRLLDEHCVAYTVDEAAISLNEEPFLSVINLSLSADTVLVQRILDERE